MYLYLFKYIFSLQIIYINVLYTNIITKDIL